MCLSDEIQTQGDKLACSSHSSSSSSNLSDSPLSSYPIDQGFDLILLGRFPGAAHPLRALSCPNWVDQSCPPSWDLGRGRAGQKKRREKTRKKGKPLLKKKGRKTASKEKKMTDIWVDSQGETCEDRDPYHL